jgi:hypothetical protein
MSVGMSKHHIVDDVFRNHVFAIPPRCTYYQTVPFMSLLSFALLLSSYVNLRASSTPITSRDVSRDVNLNDSDCGLAFSTVEIYSPPINLPCSLVCREL